MKKKIRTCLKMKTSNGRILTFIDMWFKKLVLILSNIDQQFVSN